MIIGSRSTFSTLSSAYMPDVEPMIREDFDGKLLPTNGGRGLSAFIQKSSRAGPVNLSLESHSFSVDNGTSMPAAPAFQRDVRHHSCPALAISTVSPSADATLTSVAVDTSSPRSIRAMVGRDTVARVAKVSWDHPRSIRTLRILSPKPRSLTGAAPGYLLPLARLCVWQSMVRFLRSVAPPFDHAVT